MALGDRILLADADGGRISSLSDEDPEFARELEAGSRPGGRRRRKPAPTPKVLAGDDAPPSLVVGSIERTDRHRILVTVGEFKGRLGVDVRNYRVLKGGPDFRPTFRGCAIRPHELDRLIAGLREARRLIAEKRPEALADAGQAGHLVPGDHAAVAAHRSTITPDAPSGRS